MLLPFFILQGCLVAWSGYTIGMWLAGLKVVCSDGSSAGFRNGVMLRYLPLILLAGLPLAGWLAAVMNKIAGDLWMDEAMAWITATFLPLLLLYVLLDSLASLTRDGRTLHDRFAGTVVTARPRRRASASDPTA